MDAIQAPVQILCKQCSAPLPVEQGTQFVNCEFCGTTNVVEKGRTVFHYAVRATIHEGAAEKALRRWMAGNQTIKGLDRDAQIKKPHFEYFPMWLVRTTKDDRENVYLEPAAALSVSELKHVNIPAGDLEHYDLEVDDSAVKATVPYNAMAGWLKDEHKIKETEISELSLVHLPIYIFKYIYDDQSYTAVIDGASGEVFANIFPSKWEVPYVTLGAIAFVVYFCAALIPLSSYLIGGTSALGLGVPIYAVALIVVTIPFFIAAMTISAKV